ncbi:c-type cytochrome [Zoogloea sp.]|uniref:c-type cytochrome n=1 Tax=Zoogloea sp. TaxID=49181 RepID=UPI0025F1ED63|nr:c-type cytochrome [Zoogloea sp.]MCK6395821.1 c-type cytochrome [Zoogloea sp.]
MFRFSKPALGGAIALALAALTAGSALADGRYAGIGRSATRAEIHAWDIDVRPDFKGLRPGSGSVDQGQEVWEAKCTSCHGSFGESNEVHTPLIGGTTKDDIKTGHVLSLVKGDAPQRSAIMKVATVSTLFDYINRAMPLTAPKSLSNDEVYALVAYLLNLAEIVPGDFVLTEKNIAEAQARMPNRNGMRTDHGMWPGASAAKGGMGNGGKPDVKNTACMSNCKTEVKIASLLPVYAETAHGNLAEQNRPVGPVRGKDTSGKAGATPAAPAPLSENAAASKLAQDSGCMACHGVAGKIVGPGYNEVLAKYRGQADAEARLAAKVKAGGQGVWGAIPMPPQTQLKDEDIRSLVKWIMSGAKAQ